MSLRDMTESELRGDLASMESAARQYRRELRRRENPKPWHDAAPGEVWALGIGGGYHGDSIAVVETDEGVRFIWGVKGGDIRNIPTDDRSIDYGTRIWPVAGVSGDNQTGDAER